MSKDTLINTTSIDTRSTQISHLELAPCSLKRTPLFAEAKEAGGKMIPFAGWELPVHFNLSATYKAIFGEDTGLIAEHHAVRQGAGVFDVSHMGEIKVLGLRALEFLSKVTCNDLTKLTPGKAQYTALLTPTGGVIDDLIVYYLAENQFLLCVNAGNTQAAFDWLLEVNKYHEVKIENQSESYGLLAVQGPKVASILTNCLELRLATALNPFNVTTLNWRGVKLIVARTGYTGEDGFEFFVSTKDAKELWTHFVDKLHIRPIGLGARDTLRLEVGYPLHGHELDLDHHPYESGIGWIVKGKGDFIGSASLEKLKSTNQNLLVGLMLLDPGISRHGDEIINPSGESVGRVTSGTKSPTLNCSICLARVLKQYVALDTELFVLVRGKKLRAKIVKVPFYRARLD